MGRDSHICCNTCRVTFYLGYGSSRSWLDAVYTVKEYIALQEVSKKKLLKNQNILECLRYHETHDIEYWNYDYTDDPHPEYTFINMYDSKVTANISRKKLPGNVCYGGAVLTIEGITSWCNDI